VQSSRIRARRTVRLNVFGKRVAAFTSIASHGGGSINFHAMVGRTHDVGDSGQA